MGKQNTPVDKPKNPTSAPNKRPGGGNKPNLPKEVPAKKGK